MSSVDIYKSTMGKGLRNFFEGYEDSIKELINNLDSEDILLRNFSEQQVTRLQNLTKSCNMALKLATDFNSVIDLNETKRIEKIEYLKKAFNTEDENRIGYHVEVSLVHAYLALLEKLKIYLLFFIDWSKLGKKHKDLYGIGTTIDCLIKKYPYNTYLDYFDSNIRNSFAHYTFFLENGGKIKLCSEIFDKFPKEITLVDLMKEIYNLNVLTEGFYIMVRDKYGIPEIKLEDMER